MWRMRCQCCTVVGGPVPCPLDLREWRGLINIWFGSEALPTKTFSCMQVLRSPDFPVTATGAFTSRSHWTQRYAVLPQIPRPSKALKPQTESPKPSTHIMFKTQVFLHKRVFLATRGVAQSADNLAAGAWVPSVIYVFSLFGWILRLNVCVIQGLGQRWCYVLAAHLRCWKR